MTLKFKSILILIILCFVVLLNFKVNAINDKIKKDKKIEVKLFDQYYNLCIELNSTNPDSSIIIAKQGYQKALEEKNVDFQIKFLKLIARSYMVLNDLQQQISLYQKIISICKANQLTEDLAETYLTISAFYGKSYDYSTAFKYILLAIETSNKVEDKRTLAKSYNNLGTFFLVLRDYKTSLIYYKKGLEIAKKIDKVSLSLVSLNNNIAIAYAELNDIENALKYQFESLSILDTLKDNRQLAITHINISDTYKKLENNDLIIKHLMLSLPYAIASEDLHIQSSVYKNIGDYYLKTKDLTNAYQFLKKGEEKSLKINDIKNLEELYKSLSEYYALKNNLVMSVNYFKLFLQMKDTLEDRESNKIISEMKVKFETSEIERENKLLKQKSVIQELQIQKQTYFRNVSIVLTSLGFILVILTFHRFRIKKRSNSLLAKKNDLIDKQNFKLNLANETKDKFFSILGKDLREPYFQMYNIIRHLKLNYDILSNDTYKENVKKISEISEYCSRYLENLLIWARSSQSNFEIEKRNLNLVCIINKSIAPFAERAKNKNIEIDISIDDNIQIYADIYTIQIVFGNVFNNAIKFSPQNSKININACKKGSDIEITFVDNGLGIESHIIEQLFMVGNNISTYGTANEKGAGLGLVICKDFMDKNNGEILINSEKGLGTKVLIRVASAII